MCIFVEAEDFLLVGGEQQAGKQIFVILFQLGLDTTLTTSFRTNK